MNNPTKLIKTFKENGCVVIPNLLPAEDCDALLKIIRQENKKAYHQTGNINSDFKRKDLMLPLTATRPYIEKIYQKIQTFCDKLHPNAKIVENSSLISYPGCYPQIWHSDTSYEGEDDANLTSFGLALTDVTKGMGPLDVYLRSNKLYKSDEEMLIEQYGIEEDDLEGDDSDGEKYQSIAALCEKIGFEKASCTCKKGSLVIWSSAVVHRGGKNVEKERPLFYFSLLGKGTAPEGSTYSMKTTDISNPAIQLG
jgi:ectoine hydroxylase-related dioxygenase (phytanoyl-CoA dioxygenase family)